MRPTEKDCGNCGTSFEVKPKGKIPDLCPDCRSGKAVAEHLAALTEAEASVALDCDEHSGTQFDPEDLEIVLPDIPDREPDPVVWTGDNLAEVRASLDGGICVDWHRGDGRPFGEVYGKDRDWFITVKPGDTVWHDGATSAG